MNTRLWIAMTLALTGMRMDAQVRPVDQAVLPEWKPEETGGNHRVWSRASDRDGGAGPAARGRENATTRVTEIATGMNYWDGQAWVPSVAEFEVTETGFEATRMQHVVSLHGDLNRVGSVSVETQDGVVLHSTPVAIGLYDAASGESLIIAGINRSVGVLVANNKVLYENAFVGLNGEGVCADVLYTIERGSFEQDVIIRGKLDPEAYGFPAATTRLQVYTEFYEAPRPQRIRRPINVEDRENVRRQMDSPDLVDEVLGFGEFVMATGRAFPVQAAVGGNAVPVAKEFVTKGGRTFLIESVEYVSIQKEFEALPPCNPRGAAKNKAEPGRRKVDYAAIPKATARDDLRAGVAKPLRGVVAKADMATRSGVVIDYIATVGGTLSSAVTFNGDTTYFVSGAVVCNGTATIEGGAVFKFKHNNTTPVGFASIKFSSTLICKTSSYRPAVFTAVDDDSVGESLNGYAGSGYQSTIQTDGYANPAIWLANLSSQQLTDMRFSYCVEAIKVEGGTGNTLSHAQLVTCIRGIVISGSGGCGGSSIPITVNNGLFSNVSSPITISRANSLPKFYHTTIHSTNAIATLATATASSTCTFYNSVFANVTALTSGSVTVGGENNGFQSCPQFGNNAVSSATAPFQTFGAGNYYLAEGSVFRNAGSTAFLPASLIADLKRRTTSPGVIASTPVGSAVWMIQASRDGDKPDLGYHYDPVDYVVNAVSVQGGQLKVEAGTVVAAYGNQSSYGISIGEGGSLTAEGSPTNLCRFVRYNVVQEQPGTAWASATAGVTIKTLPGTTANPTAAFRFAEFATLASQADHVHLAGPLAAAARFTDCQFGVGGLWVDANASGIFTNCLFDRVDGLYAGNGGHFHNNLFFGGTFNVSSGAPYAVTNNLFDRATIVNGTTFQSHNGYVTNAPGQWLTPTNSADVFATSLTYETGALGRFYQPSGSPFLNKGSVNANAIGLYHYTVLTNNTKEANTVVDLGFHYVAAPNGTPVDTDSEGLPDYVEDANGNGLVEATETSGSNADTDYDGITDRQEREEGTNPLSATDSAKLALAFWTFNANFTGGQGQLPSQNNNTTLVPGLGANAAKLDSPNTLKLIYKDVESSGEPNFNAQNGTIRFWVKPNWSSANRGGPGPGSAARLFEVGGETDPEGWFALYLNASGTELRFSTRIGATTDTNITVSWISWSSNEWYQIALTYSATNSALYTNGVLAASGTGVRYVPSAMARLAGLSIGSDKAGAQKAHMQFEETDVFNYPLTAGAIAATHSNGPTEVNTCALYPIALPMLPNNQPYQAQTPYTKDLGTGTGHFGWLDWNGRSFSSAELAVSLTPPGNVADLVAGYRDPENPSRDRVLSKEDWVHGSPGVKSGVTDQINLLKQQPFIVVPIWDLADGIGANRKYRVNRFAKIRVDSFSPGGNGGSGTSITFTMLDDDFDCGDICQNNQPPTLTSVSTLPNGREDDPYWISFDLLTSSANEADLDGEGPTLFRIETVLSGTLTIDNLPIIPGVTFLMAGQTMRWIPAPDVNGTVDAFTVRAYDRCAVSASPVTVRVALCEVNDAPMANEDTKTTQQNIFLGIAAADLLANDTAGPANESGQTRTVTAVGYPTPGGASGATAQGGTVSLSGTTITYTPPANFNGSDTVTYQLSDNGQTCTAAASLSAVGTVNITVTPQNNTPPTISAIADLSINEETAAGPIAFTVGDANTDAYALTLSVASSVQSIVQASDIQFGGAGANRTVTVRPGPNKHGVVVITVTVSDGALSASEPFQLTINPVNDPPVANAGSDFRTYQPTVALTGSVVDPEDGALARTWSKVSGPGTINFTGDQATFTAAGIYVIRLSGTDSGGLVGADIVVVTYEQNQAPVVSVGPDREVAPNAGGAYQVSLNGEVSDDDLPVGRTLRYAWSSVPSGVVFNPSSAAATTATLPGQGIYKLKLTVTEQVGATDVLSGSDELTAIGLESCGRVFTHNADFAEGSLLNVNFTDFPDQLQLNKTISPYPYVNIACSGRGTVVRIDANTGQVLGEYRTAPGGRDKFPSRMAVDRAGNIWVGNRAEGTAITVNGTIVRGSVTRIGLVIGGTRTAGLKDAAGNYIPDPTGDYLAPPFLYNTCRDRDNDGLIKTSRGLGYILDWDPDPDPLDGVNGPYDGEDDDGGVALAEDECIINYVRVVPSGVRTMAIDANNDLWVGANWDVHEKINGQTGERYNIQFPPANFPTGFMFDNGAGYGGVIDSYGVLWSMQADHTPNGGGIKMLRLDTTVPPGQWQINQDGTTTNPEIWRWVQHGHYGVAVDPRTGEIWQGRQDGSKLHRIDRFGGQLAEYPGQGGKTLTVDGAGNVWVSGGQGGGDVKHFRTDGTFVGAVPLPCNGPTPAGPTAVSPDSNGKIWTANESGNSASRIDPAGGPVGRGGHRVGAVDLVVDLGAGAAPYDHSDLTGFTSIGVTKPSGVWTVIHDGGPLSAGQTRHWRRIAWKQVLVANTEITVQIRAEDEEGLLPGKQFVTITVPAGVDPKDGIDIPNVPGRIGRYVEIKVTLAKNVGATPLATPILESLAVSCSTTLPETSTLALAPMARPDHMTVLQNTEDNVIDVLANDPIGDEGTLPFTFKPGVPANGRVKVSSSGTALEYTPNPGFFGTDRFTYTVRDAAGAVGRAVVEVAVLKVNLTALAPVAVDDGFEDEITVAGSGLPGPGAKIDIDVLANDCFENYGNQAECDLRITAVARPTHGGVAFSCGSHITYFPPPFFVGEDTFQYTISNGDAEATATVKVRVTGEFGSVVCGQPVSGSLGGEDFKDEDDNSGGENQWFSDWYHFNPVPGQPLVIALNSAATEQLPAFRPRVELWQDGHRLASAQADFGDPAMLVGFATPSASPCRIRVTSHIDDLGGDEGAYTLSVTCSDFRVTRGDASYGLNPDDELDFGFTPVGVGARQSIRIHNLSQQQRTFTVAVNSTLPFGIATSENGPYSSDPPVAFTIPALSWAEAFLEYLPTGPNFNGFEIIPHTGSLDLTEDGIEPFMLNLVGTANDAATEDLPTVTIAQPQNNTRMFAENQLVIVADVVPGLYAVQRVDFHIRNVASQQVFSTSDFEEPYRVDWTALPGEFVITAKVYDGNGAGSASQPVSIKVDPRSANYPPVATDDQFTVVADTQNNSFPVLANDFDPEGHAIQIASYEQPGLGTVRQDGNVFRYTPHANTIGTDYFPYTISDGSGGLSQGVVEIRIVESELPRVAITAPAYEAIYNAPFPASVTISAEAIPNNDATIRHVQFFVDGERLGTDVVTGGPRTAFSFAWSNPRSGDRWLTAVATDSKGRIRTSNPVLVHFNPVPFSALPVARITDPVPSTSVIAGCGLLPCSPRIRSASLNVAGEATFGNAQVSYRALLFNSQGIAVAQTTTVTDNNGHIGPVGSMDVSSLENGVYRLELQVWNSVGSRATDSVDVIIDSEAKIGHFTFTVQDLVLPTAGIPLTLTRTYDSRNKAKGDFGFGWTFSFTDMDFELDEFRELAQESDGEIFSMRAGGGRDVTLTLPDGRRVTFAFTPEQRQNDYLAVWTAPPGVSERLFPTFDLATVPEETIINLSPWLHWADGSVRTPFEHFDVPGFILETLDRTKYVFGREDFGDRFPETEMGENIDVHAYGPPRLVRIILPSGERVEIGQDRLDHYSQGTATRSVVFHRDAEGRIEQVFDASALNTSGEPVGRAVLRYEYDKAGNLERVLRLRNTVGDPEYDILTYVYADVRPGFEHYITDIVDPRGAKAVRTFFYDDGRIQKVVEADDSESVFFYETASAATAGPYFAIARHRTRENRRNLGGALALFRETVNEYDARGNVVYTEVRSATETLGAGLKTWREFDPVFNRVVKDINEVRQELVGGIPRRYVREFAYDDPVVPLQPTEVRGPYPSENRDVNRLRVTKFTYTPYGQVATQVQPKFSSVNPAAVFTEHQYDNDGPSATFNLKTTIAHVTDRSPATFEVVKNEYENQRLKYATDPAGTIRIHEYYAAGESGGRFGDLKRLIMRERSTTSDPLAGRILAQEDYAYDANRNLLTRTVRRTKQDLTFGTDLPPIQEVTEYVYDVQNRRVGQYDPRLLGQPLPPGIERTGYNPAGLVAVRTNRFGNITRYLYNGLGELIETSFPDNTLFRSATYYQGSERHVVVEDKHFANEPVKGRRTVYDVHGRTIRNERLQNVVIGIAPQGDILETTFTSADAPLSVTQSSYYDDGRILQQIDARNNVTTYTDDPYRDWQEINEASGLRVTRLEFDKNGNQTARRVNAPGLAPEFIVYSDFDDLNRHFRTRFPGDTVPSPNRHTKETDNAGNVTLEINPDGNKRRLKHDGLARLTEVTLGYDTADAATTMYQYDEAGNLLSITDANSPPRVTRFEYDSLSRRIKRRLPGGQIEQWEFPVENGVPANKVIHSDFRLPTLRKRYEFDSMNRIIAKVPESDFGSFLANISIGFTYTATGQRKTMQSGSGLTRYVYDAFDRIQIKASPIGTLTYAYDVQGNLEGVTTARTYVFSSQGKVLSENAPLPDRSNVAYSWDNVNRLWKVNPGNAANEVIYAYEGSELKRVEYPNGLDTDYSYNGSRHLTLVNINKTGFTPPERARFDYNTLTPLKKSGLRQSLDDRIYAPALQARTVQYEYDALDRLKKENIATGTPSGQITYDSTAGYADSGFEPVGNRRSRTVSTQSLIDAGVSQYTGGSAHTFDANDRLNVVETYDDNGNTLRGLVSPAQTADDEYDFEGRLIYRDTTIGGNPAVIELLYDGDGNRVRKKVTINSVTTTTYYLVDDLNPTGYAQVIEESTVLGGPPAKRYLYGLDLIRQETRQGAGSYLNHYYGYDGHGTVRFLSDQSGTVTDTYTYDGFGIKINQSHTGAGPTDNLYLYAGEQFDPHLGLYYLRARFYNPFTGRLWTMDTFEGYRTDPLSLHKFIYAHGSPINLHDPSGREVQASQISTIGGISTLAARTFTTVARVGRFAKHSVSRSMVRAARLRQPDPTQYLIDRLMGMALSTLTVEVGIGTALVTEEDEESRGKILYRGMKGDTMPELGETATTLGIRERDIRQVQNGMVLPVAQGLSVTPENPSLLPGFILELLKEDKVKVWGIYEGLLNPSLTYRPDPENPRSHGFIAPLNAMPVNEYKRLIQETQRQWAPLTPDL